jgi:hypothetical protein
MSSLAMSAELINNDNAQSDSSIYRKKQMHNKTQKLRQYDDFDPKKVNSVLQSIHNNAVTDDDDELGNYNPKGTMVSAKHSENFKPLNPYDYPVSMGVEKTKEGLTNLVPQPNENDALNLQDLNSSFMNDSQVRDYYKKLVPNYQHNNSIRYNSTPNSTSDSNQVLIEKLNYMINLLEEQQDQKLDSVTEDVVLYSFLGIFIIFIVDSFTKVGKYVR